MVKIHELLDENLVELDLSAENKKESVKELLDILKRNVSNLDTDKLYIDIMAKEKDVSTGIGDGIAIAHCLIEGIKKTIIVFGIKQKGLNFNSLDNKPVNLFFLLIGEEGKRIKHLQILSKLSRLLHNSDFRAELLKADSVENVINLFKKRES